MPQLLPSTQPSLTDLLATTLIHSEAEDKTQTIARIRLMAKALPEIGFLMPCLSILNQAGWLNADQMHYFKGAVIFGKTDWNGTLPEDMIKKLIQAVSIERFWLLLDEAETGKETQNCTSAEIVCALQPYSLVGPLETSHAELLLWSFSEMLRLHPDIFGQTSETWAEDTKDNPNRPPARYTFLDVSITIRRHVINSAKATARTDARQKTTPDPEAATPDSAQPVPQIQYSLFDVNLPHLIQ